MKNSISRRSFLKAVGALSAAGALAACGGSSSSSTAASSTAASAAASTAAGANIKLWTYPIGGWGKDETVQELISSFNAKYPDIKVTVEYLDYTNGDDQVNTAIEGGSAPDLIMEGPERLVANWGKKGVMAPLNDLWTDDAKKDIYASVESACRNDAGDYYEYPLCMTAHCMAVNMTKVKEVGADQYIDTDKHTWSTDGFLKTVDALYNGGYENVAAIYCSGQGGDQGTRAIINNMYGGTFTDAAHTKYTADSAENISSTLRIFPRIGRIACVRRFLAVFAEPPAESPSTIKTSHSSGLRLSQFANFPFVSMENLDLEMRFVLALSSAFRILADFSAQAMTFFNSSRFLS